ncbi:ThiF family adenylyltransferase [Prevotella disiens]|uniref:ThiF family adenylyltransferase n=1 Tax=Prevotella disiens TaxID=28130 RepID=UPI00242C4DDE|nr:ThiF family adenylyltransferase [Prevotella disiens]
MEERYNRNRLYVSENEQSMIKDYKIFLGGAGIGSIVAECALRLGFEHITIVDGDKVEKTNLNRQNYTENDIGRYKAECLAERLLSINPNAHIAVHTKFLTSDNIEALIANHNVAINALDFKDETPFLFDKICKMKKIPVLHPYNFGWAGFVTVVDPLGHSLSELSDNPKGFELKVAEYVTGHGAFWNQPKEWLDKIVGQYKEESNTLPPPQLSIASWIAAGLCTTAMYNLATGKAVNYFPKFYFSSLLQ